MADKYQAAMLFAGLLRSFLSYVQKAFQRRSNVWRFVAGMLLVCGGAATGLQAQPAEEQTLSAWQADSLEIREKLAECLRHIRKTNRIDSLDILLRQVEQREDMLCQIPELKAAYLLRRVDSELIAGRYAAATASYKEVIPIYAALDDTLKIFTVSYSLVIHAYLRCRGEEALRDVLHYGEMARTAYARLRPEVQAQRRTQHYQRKLEDAVKSAQLWLALPSQELLQLRALERKADSLFHQGKTLHNTRGLVMDAKEYYDYSQRCYDTIFATIEAPMIWSNFFAMRRYLHMSLWVGDHMGQIPRSTGEYLAELERSLTLAREKLPPGNLWIEQFTCDLAGYHRGQDPLQALDILLRDSISFTLGGCTQCLANVYTVLGDYGKAKELHQSLIDASPNAYTNALHIQDYALFLVASHEFAAAQYYAEQALEKLGNWLRPSHPRFAFAKQALAAVYVQQQKYPEAISLITDAKRIMTAVGGDRAQELLDMHKIHVEALLGHGQVAEAAAILPQAYLCLPNSTYLFHHANLKILSAQVMLAQEEYRRALDTILAGVALLQLDQDEEVRPTYQRSLMSLLHWEAQVLKTNYRTRCDPALLKESLAAAQRAIAILHEVRESFYWESSKRELMATSEPIIKSAIETCISLHEIFPQEGYDWQAFSLSEQLKSVLLLEATQQGRRLAADIIPADIREQEKELQIQLTALSNQRYRERERGKEADLSKIASLSIRIKSLKIKFDSLNLVIEDQYPLYHKRRNQIDILDKDRLQAALPRGATMLNYVLLDSSVVVFAVGRDTFTQLHLQSKVDVQDLVSQLQKAVLSKLTEEDPGPTPASDAWPEVAHQLYQALIEPLEDAGLLADRLIIVPDGVLGYIPFELLLKRPPGETEALDRMAYLLKDHVLSYANSASLLMEMQELKHIPKRRSVLAFAPTFAPDTNLVAETQALEVRRSTLGPLLYNQREVERISTIVPTDIFEGQQATEPNFLASASDYSILHLATHSKANDRLGDQAYVAFTEMDDGSENEFLFNSELYNLRIQADMVVLSACETGIGELNNAEGIISLARGFSYAGAKSIVSSLWAVNDAATEEIMVDYYANLAAGQTKDAALRAAKLRFLDTYQGEAHPFYWAPFVVIGDTAPLQFGNSGSRYWLISGGIFMLFLFLYLLLWRKNSSLS